MKLVVTLNEAEICDAVAGWMADKGYVDYDDKDSVGVSIKGWRQQESGEIVYEIVAEAEGE